LDGRALCEFSTSDLWDAITVVFQDHCRYPLSAAENIAFGEAGLPNAAARITTAARYAGAHKVIERLPNGYQTILSRLFEGGDDLSAGEWQKIALARALHKDAGIVLLDEPTSSLDTRTETQFLRRLREIADGRIILVISHRLPTVMTADLVYVMEDGRIVESGTHEDLMQLRGKYHALFSSQI
jgi:ATP-binding cassette subfamily B protein